MQRPDLSSTGQYIVWYARDAPEAIAIAGEGSNITYQRLAVDLVHCVRALKATAVGPRSLVGLHIARHYQKLLLLLACEIAGATAVSLTSGDFADGDDVVPHCDLILTDAAPSSSGPPKTIAVPPDWLARLSLSAVRAEHLSPLEREIPPDQIVRVVRTSGTTGRRKAMPMSHATQQLRVVRTIGRVADDILPHPRMVCLYDLGVGTVYVRVLGVLQHGGTVFHTALAHVPALIAAGAVNYGTFSLTDIERLVQSASPPPAGHKMHVEVFGATVALRLREQIRRRLNARVTNKYASNETNPIAVIGDDNVGTLYPGVEVRIVDEAGRDLPHGEPGLIRVKTETMVHGYFNNPALTEASFIGGWYQTSDFGIMPEPGKLMLLGRADDMLNIGGVKIAPAPIEARVKLIGGIADAVVMSVASANDVGLLLVVVEVDGNPRPADLAEQISLVASDYVPAFEIMLSRRFPRTETGKVKRHELEAAYRQRAVGEGIATGGGRR
jgi:acyl-coenzyme A synthetase/AMP-(fatty) acid ligase